jgi:hypothetical protein
MTLAAVSAELAVVRVVLFVAVDAGPFAGSVATLRMAGAARKGLVLALEAEPRMGNVLGPGHGEAGKRRVAPTAILAELALMVVLVTIDTDALAGAVDSVRVALRTLVAILQLLVPADQREMRIPVVVERLGA